MAIEVKAAQLTQALLSSAIGNSPRVIANLKDDSFSREIGFRHVG